MVAETGEAPVGLVDASGTFSCEPVVARVSRGRLVASLQVAEVVAVALSLGIWLQDVSTAAEVRLGLPGALVFGAAVAVLVYFVLRSLGASWAVVLQPDSVWPSTVRDWVSGGASIGLVRRLGHNVAILSDGSDAKHCAQPLRTDESGTNVVCFVKATYYLSDRIGHRQGDAFIARLRQLIQVYGEQDIIILTSEQERAKLPDLLRGVLCLPIRALIWPHSLGDEPRWIAGVECRAEGSPLLLTKAPPLDGWRWVKKDVLDRGLALVLLIFCATVLLAIAMLIPRCRPGSILFRQEQEGYNGKKFAIFKFRIMSLAPWETDRVVLTEKRDSRLYPLGAFLRKTSLDELPQLLNVLREDMWIAGLRPRSPLATAAGESYSAAVTHYMARQKVKPGITGWAQVNGWCGATTTVEQIQHLVVHDLYYIDHWSVWLNFQILLQTVVKASFIKMRIRLANLGCAMVGMTRRSGLA